MIPVFPRYRLTNESFKLMDYVKHIRNILTNAFKENN